MNRPPHPLMQRRYADVPTFEEVWFIEVSLGPDSGFWLRYTIKDGTVQAASTWAIVFEGDKVTARRDDHPLAELQPAGFDVFTLGENRLDADGAVGSAGEISWKLKFTPGMLAHDHVPDLLKNLGLTKRLYVPAYLDLTLDGVLKIGDREIEVKGGRGMMGHIWGTKNNATSIAWGHCNTFDDSDAVYEMLSAQLQLGPVKVPKTASAVLWLDGHPYRFSSTRRLFRNSSREDWQQWHLSAEHDDVRLEATATFPHASRCARLTYLDAHGRQMFCQNSRMGALRVHLIDSKRGIDRILESNTAAIELQRREKMPGDVHL